MGEARLDGIRGDPGAGYSAIPVRLLVNIPDAVAMRVANSPEALALAEWRDYAAESAWSVPTGAADRTVYVEFRTADGSIVASSIAVPPYDESLGADYSLALPISSAVSHDGLGGAVWTQDFALGRDGWGSNNGAGQSQPLSWSSAGGVGGGAHVWSDASRWASEAGVNGPVTFALTERVLWADPRRTDMDFTGESARFQLDGSALDLKGGSAFFWVEDSQGLWRSSEPLDLGMSAWAANRIDFAGAAPGSWTSMSGLEPGAGPDFAAIQAWGIAFDGYAEGDEPAGVLRLDEFHVIADPSPGPSVANLDQALSFAEGAASVAIAPITVDSSSDGAEVSVTLRLSDASAGSIEGAGIGVAGLYTVSGSAEAVNAALAGLVFVPQADWDRPVAIEVSVRNGIVTSPVVVGTISLAPIAESDAPTATNLDQNIVYATDGTAVAITPIVVSDPDDGALIEVTLALSDPGAGALHGRVAFVDGAYRVIGTVAEVNAALATLAFLPATTTAGEVGIAVTVDDGTGSPVARGTILLAGRSNATPEVEIGALSIVENSALGAPVGTVAATDADGDPLSYRLIDDAGGRFAIDSAGRITVADPLMIDFEGDPAHSIVARVTDSLGAHVDSAFTVQVTDMIGETVVGDFRNHLLRGGVGDDRIYGSVGFDTLIGGVGDDWYFTFNRRTAIVEQAGESAADRVLTAVSYRLAPGVGIETLSTTDHSGAAPIDLSGNEIANTIYGNAGDNVIAGGFGADYLQGNAGRDIFVFDSPLDPVGNADMIADFVSGEDRIQLDSRIFAGLAAGGLAPDAFHAGDAASDPNHRIIHDPTTGLLSFDIDGSGEAAAVAFATIGDWATIAAEDFTVARPIVAADLAPGQLIVVGVPGSTEDGFGGVPVRLLANFQGAVAMRFGNTPEGLAGAEWRDYSATSDWLARTGVGEQTVLAEYRMADGSVRGTSALVPAYDSDLGTTLALAPSDAYQIGGGDGLLWRQGFSEGADRWAAYDYDGGNPRLGNVFYPGSWSSSGGADGGGYVWADDSRWRIDTPEDPHSILPLLTYPGWLTRSSQLGVSLEGTTVQFYLRGDDLDLNGAEVYFWVLDSSGRWKNYAQTLDVGDGEWAFNSVDLSSAQAADWAASYQYADAGSVDFGNIYSWGIAFVGFGQGEEPTGAIAIDEFVIGRPAAPVIDNADQRISFDADGDSVAIAPLLVSGPYPTARISVTLTVSDPSVGVIEGAGAGVNGVHMVEGALATVNAILAHLRFRSFEGAGETTTISVSVDGGASGSMPTSDVITLIGQDANVAPAGLELAGPALVAAENAAPGAVVGSVTATDPNGGPIGYTLSNDAGGRFAIDADGRISVAPGILLDHEQATSHLLTVRATDEFGAFLERPFAVAVADVAPETVRGGDTDDLIVAGAGDDILDGGGGGDFLAAGSGDDRYLVDDARDFAYELPDGGNDRVLANVSYQLRAGSEIETLSTDWNAWRAPIRLTGNEFGQNIYGNAGDNILDGRGGADLMIGSVGDDWYYVDDAGDRPYEAIGGGEDRVLASASYQLMPGTEIETLSTVWNAGTAPIRLIGNEFAQNIYGNAGDNILDGRGGADLMIGFGGDDRYYVDDAGDWPYESVGGGNDRVLASVSYQLRSGGEIETLSTTWNAGTAPIDLIGNAFAQHIYGNEGDNIIDGRGGADLMIGFGGDDSYYVDDDGDRPHESMGGGNDRVFASGSYRLTPGAEIETLSTDWNAGTAPIELTGNAFAQNIYGNAGDNILDGGGGADSLIGAGGRDIFLLAAPPVAGGGNPDILDFTRGEDRIGLGAAAFGLAPGVLPEGAFRLGAEALDVDDRFLYDPASGILMFDENGSAAGGAIAIARLTPAADLSHADFVLI